MRTKKINPSTVTAIMILLTGQRDTASLCVCVLCVFFSAEFIYA